MRSRILVATLAVSVLSACGLPTGGVEDIDASRVPYQLLSEAEAASATPGSAVKSHPVLYWVAGDKLVANQSAWSCRPGGVQLVEKLLDELLPGPADDARARGLTSAIVPGTELAVEELVDGTAVIDFQAPNPISADLLPLALGQIVLTVTSAPDVDAVLLTTDGQPIEIPVPGGALTASAVTADDYTSVVRAPRGTSPEEPCV